MGRRDRRSGHWEAKSQFFTSDWLLTEGATPDAALLNGEICHGMLCLRNCEISVSSSEDLQGLPGRERAAHEAAAPGHTDGLAERDPP